MTIDSAQRPIPSSEDLQTVFVRDPANLSAIGPAVCALLNSEGGTVFCGVDDNGNVVGLPGSAREAVKRLEPRLKRAISPTAFFSIGIDSHGDGELLSIDVPTGKDKPYVFEGSVFVRDGGKTKAADATVLRALVQDQGSAQERWERRISPGMSEEDLDHHEVSAFVRESTDRFQFTERSDDLAVLQELSLVNSSSFTNAGDVLFSTRPSNRHPQSRVRLLMLPTGKSGTEFGDSRWIEGPLVRAFHEVFDAIGAVNVVRSTFEEDNPARQDQQAYAKSALREGLVNAFVHRDYASFSGGLRVSVYANRIEIWNSGRLPEELRPGDLRKDHPSIPPNPDLSQIFYLRGLMERTGRGTEKIIEACRELGAQPPRWQDQPSGVTLTLYSALAAPPAAPELNPRQVRLLERLPEGELLTLGDYRRDYEPQLSERQSRRDLAELESVGLVEKVGRGPATAYRRRVRIRPNPANN